MTVEFESDALSVGEFDRYRAEVEVDYIVDKNYGADADGNRGIEKLFINDVKVRNIIDFDGNEFYPLPPIQEKIEDEIWTEVWKKIEV